MNKPISKVWTFISDSNSHIEYETLQFVDGTMSCNCKGWTMRIAVDGSRSCKHTRYVDMGIADEKSKAFHLYEPQHEKPQSQNQHGKSKIHSVPKLGHRKFAV